MILMTIINVFMQTFVFIIQRVINAGPAADIAHVVENYSTYINAIINISTQAVNFLHFIIGDTIAILVPAAIGLLAFKYLIAPVINLILRLLPFVDI